MAYEHYYTDMEKPPETLLLSTPLLLYSGFVAGEPNWHFTRHSHPFCEIVYVCEGSGHYRIGDLPYTASKGDLLVYNAGTMHEEYSDPENPLKTYFCGIDHVRFPGLDEGFLISRDASPVLHTGEYAYKLESYISDLVNESSEKHFGYETVCSNLLSSILIFSLRLAGIGHPKAPIKPVSGIGQNVREYIDRHYASHFDLSALAKKTYVSKHYLAHVFKDEIGFSPIDYLIRKRMEEAKRLLTVSDLTVNQIAGKIGYDDPNYFSSLFKKLTGFSPMQYRKQQKDDCQDSETNPYNKEQNPCQ